jgi:hypothetical protein
MDCGVLAIPQNKMPRAFRPWHFMQIEEKLLVKFSEFYKT